MLRENGIHGSTTVRPGALTANDTELGRSVAFKAIPDLPDLVKAKALRKRLAVP